MTKNSITTDAEKSVVLVDFTAEWCAPCKVQKPVIKKILEKYRDRAVII